MKFNFGGFALHWSLRSLGTSRITSSELVIRHEIGGVVYRGLISWPVRSAFAQFRRRHSSDSLFHPVLRLFLSFNFERSNNSTMKRMRISLSKKKEFLFKFSISIIILLLLPDEFGLYKLISHCRRQIGRL